VPAGLNANERGQSPALAGLLTPITVHLTRSASDCHPAIQLRYPKSRADLETRVVDDEMIVFDVAAQRVHRLNASASIIWRRCDGRTSVDEIANHLATAHDLPVARVADDVQQTLAELERYGLISDASTPL